MSVTPFIKILSRTDAGESSTHQSGILLPVTEGERLFPKSMRVTGGAEFQCEDHTGRVWAFRFFHKAKAHESRITLITQYIHLNLIRSGDTLKLYPPAIDGEPYRIDYKPANTSIIRGEELLEGVAEGAVRTIYVNQHERDSHNRKAAISKHGLRCFGCRLEMAEMYGEIAQGYIHIHHTKPISLGEQIPEIDDLIPLCPNCHAIVHLESPPLTVNRLKEIIREKS